MVKPWDRTFRDGDQRLFAGFTARMVGQRCATWRKSYGRTGTLHLGQLREKDKIRPTTVYKDRGEWVVSLLDCDRRLTLEDQILDSTTAGDDAVLDRMGELQGRIVEDVHLDPELLSLVLRFSDGIILELVSDPASSDEEEQWAIQLPEGQAIVAYGRRRWVLEEPSP